MYDALQTRGFEFFDEFIALYRDAQKEETRERLILRIAEFLFPRLRPVDSDGKADQTGEHISELVKTFSEMLNEPKPHR